MLDLMVMNLWPETPYIGYVGNSPLTEEERDDMEKPLNQYLLTLAELTEEVRAATNGRNCDQRKNEGEPCMRPHGHGGEHWSARDLVDEAMRRIYGN